MSGYQNKLQAAYASLGVKSVKSLRTVPEALTTLAEQALDPDRGSDYADYLSELASHGAGQSYAATGSPDSIQTYNLTTALFWFLEYVRLHDKTSRKYHALNAKTRRVKPVAVYTDLMRAIQLELVAAIQSQLHSTQLLNAMAIVKHTTKCDNVKSKIGDPHQEFTGTLVLKSKRQPLDVVLNELPRGNLLPMLLRRPERKGYKFETSSNLVRSHFKPGQWMPYDTFSSVSFPQSSHRGNVWIARAQDDAVVIRYQIPMPSVFTYLAPTKQRALVAKLWAATAKL